MDAGAWIRAVRRSRSLSQRELAARAGVPCSTVARAESGRHAPTVATMVKLLNAGGYELILVDQHGQRLSVDEEHDRIRDRTGRRFPAHLPWGGKPDYWDPDAPSWWGWHSIAWYWNTDPVVPDNVYWRRRKTAGLWFGLVPDHEMGYLWDDAT